MATTPDDTTTVSDSDTTDGTTAMTDDETTDGTTTMTNDDTTDGTTAMTDDDTTDGTTAMTDDETTDVTTTMADDDTTDGTTAMTDDETTDVTTTMADDDTTDGTTTMTDDDTTDVTTTMADDDTTDGTTIVTDSDTTDGTATETDADASDGTTTVTDDATTNGTTTVTDDDSTDGTTTVTDDDTTDGTTTLTDEDTSDGTTTVTDDDLTDGTTPVYNNDTTDGTTPVTDSDTIDGTTTETDSDASDGTTTETDDDTTDGTTTVTDDDTTDGKTTVTDDDTTDGTTTVTDDDTTDGKTTVTDDDTTDATTTVTDGDTTDGKTTVTDDDTTDGTTTVTDDDTTDGTTTVTDADATDGTTSMTDAATTDDTTTLASTTVTDNAIAAETIYQMYPSGDEEGDIRLRNALDTTSGAITAPRGVYFGHRKYRNIYTYTSEDIFNEKGQFLIEVASKEVMRYTNVADFEATWIMKVTWKDVFPYPYYCYNPNAQYRSWCRYLNRKNPDDSEFQTVNHQIVLVTDGIRTYALFNYGKMAWRRWKNVNIGFDAGDTKNFFNHYLFRDDALLGIDNMKGNTGLNGKWIFRLDLNGDNRPNFEKKCVSWAVRDRRSSPRNVPIWWRRRDVEPCPCMVWQAWRDRRFRMNWRSFCAHQRFPSREGYGQSCCYNNDWWTNWRSWGTLLTDVRYGAGHFERYHYRSNRRKHKRKDTLPRYYCCEASDNCKLFTELRPVDTCQAYVPPRWSWFWGDPHVRTLDGKTYSFNGLGEYWLIKTTDDYFTLQGRTSKALTSNGTATKATVFTAFAAKEESSDQFYVELADNMVDMIIRVNGEDVTDTVEQLASEDPPNTLDKTSLSLGVDSDGVVTAAFATGFSLNVSVSVRSLSITITAPVLVNSSITTAGLMGTFNGNTSDEYAKPNGEVLPENSIDTEVYHDFGELWKITQNESIFWYRDNETTANFSNASFEPLFLSNFTEEEQNEANTKCNSEIACVFDYLATGDESVADATLSTDLVNTADAKVSENVAPRLSVEAVQNFTVGFETTFEVSAFDNDSDTVFILLTSSLPIGAQFDNQSGLFNFTPSSITPFNLSFMAEDDLGARSPETRLVIWICSNCTNGNGLCNFGTESEEQTDTTGYFYEAMCDCNTGWEGDNCGVDIDGCEGEPCGESSNCTDVTPSEQQITGNSFNCSQCPDGTVTVDNKCIDIDECVNVTLNECQQECINKKGGYSCECLPGYSAINTTHCQDINECIEATSGCDQICNNTEGNFTCSCEDGFTLNADGKSCQRDVASLGPCLAEGLTCEYGCRNTSAPPVCFCKNGYNVTDAENCTNINECELGIDGCSGGCTDMDGSFKCSCGAGFQLGNDQKSCQGCDSIHWGIGCANLCECGSRARQCNASIGCTDCVPGWGGENCEEDIDECAANSTICGDNAQCVNNNGSYACLCNTGFQQDGDIVRCLDINECATLQPCDPNADCTNTQGSFDCTCKSGYDGNGTECENINECSNGICGNDAVCTDTPGSYICSCGAGCKKPIEARVNVTREEISGNDMEVRVELIDGFTMLKHENIDWKGHTWNATMTLLNSNEVSGTLVVTVSPATFDVNSGIAVISGRIIDIEAPTRIFLEIHVVSEPSDYNFTVISPYVDVMPVGYQPISEDNRKTIQLYFDADYDSIVAGREDLFIATLYNHFMPKYYKKASFTGWTTSKGSIIAEFTVQGSVNDITSVLYDIYDEVDSGLEISFNDSSIEARREMFVDGVEYYGRVGSQVAGSALSTGGLIGVIVASVLGGAAVVIVVVILILKNKAKDSKVSPREEHNDIPTNMRQPTTITVPDSKCVDSKGDASEEQHNDFTSERQQSDTKVGSQSSVVSIQHK
ncbi:unnamed protein product [Owenia fusiformis]|uniref:Mucin-like protein n=1 Tax=Owenia fusiformis TaxID=6347 RepID=A0A8S4Q5M6_OWEFU|nr:unnamed protein product [Owenia fusiformis]